jgi:AAA domain-containing protein/primase/DNA polymerase family protein
MNTPSQGRMQHAPVPAPAGLASYHQFISCRLVPNSKGKYDKVPCDELGNPISAFDRTQWRDYATIAARPWPAAFVLTREDPFFCIDLDGAVVAGQWSPLAVRELTEFPGAYLEISQSGQGCHIWGSGSNALPHGHRTRRGGHAVEVYTADRFIMLGTPLGGDAGRWFGPQLVACMERNNLPLVVEAPSLDAGRDPTWSGPEDDAELLGFALAQRPTTSQMFGGALTFKDIWEYNVAAFKAKFPQGDGFDHSSIDFSLMSHLSYFTGRDEQRMHRLFQEWVGYRPEKYDRRPALLVKTVGKGTTNPNVMQRRAAQLAPPAVNHASGHARTPCTDLLSLNDGEQIERMDFAPLEYIVDDMIPMGCWLLVGKPKRGKTWMMLNLALAIASGGMFLEQQCVQGKVLYLALEDNKRRIQDRMRKLCVLMGLNAQKMRGQIKFAAIEDDVPTADGGLYDMIASALDRQPDIRLVIIDTLHKARPTPRNGEGVYAYDRRTIDPLTDMLASRPGRSIMVVHHTRKTKSDDPYEMASGSMGLTGAADGHIFLVHDDQGQTVMHLQGRDAEPLELAMEMVDNVWTVKGDPEVAGMSDTRAKIIHAMSKYSFAVAAKDIAKDIGIEANTVTQRLRGMAKDGFAFKEQYGKYVLTPKAQALGIVPSSYVPPYNSSD